jgi:hypothetical protein
MVGGVAIAAWLAGILVVLRGSKPAERPAILRAYTFCNPLAYLGRYVGRMTRSETACAESDASVGAVETVADERETLM